MYAKYLNIDIIGSVYTCQFYLPNTFYSKDHFCTEKKYLKPFLLR